METLRKFAHRWSPLAGTVDSICYECVATVATVRVESELFGYEQKHVCDPDLIEQFGGAKDALTANPTRQ